MIAMRARTRRLALSAVAGVLVGSALTFAGLIGFGRRLAVQPSATPVPIPLGTPKATPRGPESLSRTPSPNGTSASPAAGEITLSALGVQLTLPAGYRLAERLQAFTTSRPGGETTRTVITTASSVQEEEYLALIRDLYVKQIATEAPELLPGQTITVNLVTDASEQAFAAQLAKTTTQIKTPSGLSGTRYVKVEGISTYDATYLTLGDGKALAVTMAYGVDAPQFDETAYTAVINGIRPLEKSS